MKLNFTSSKDLAAQPIPTHVILASQSVGRKMLLEKLGIRFRPIVTRIDEDAIVDADPYKMIKKRALAKLEEVLAHPRVYTLDEKAKNLIITADSMAIIGKRTFGKPNDKAHAKEMLKELMDRSHTFVTTVAAALLDNTGSVKKRWEKTEETKVTFRKMTNAEIDLYITHYDFSRYAAAYALNEAPWDLVTKIDGSYTNVIGLPFEVVLPIFKSLDIIALPETL